ncbi:MAG: phosphatidate cytidylyltransferase, partial [Candidatus Cloacimonetes bacterium]|nr:phosphatidate cytidylyltransferase [Candidatus Cloacimonadota bacterium]MCK9242980.1 phosphatidate cytidylyltransferase [Candidatus Cloacimonadota bacterium]
AAASIAFLSIGDTFAALVGMNFGERKFVRSNKTLEGSLACFVSCMLFGLWWLRSPWLAITGALAATIAELVDVSLDDNIKIPLVAGIMMSLISVFI